MIKVQKKNHRKFLAIIKEGNTSSRHEVILDEEYYQYIAYGKITKEELIERSFEFLLEREPKESILSKFDLRIIKNYFPEYERKIKESI